MCHCESFVGQDMYYSGIIPGRHENRLLLSLPAGLRQGLLWTICSGSLSVSQLLEIIWSCCKAYVITFTFAVRGAELFSSCGPHWHNDKASHHIQVLLRAIDQRWNLSLSRNSNSICSGLLHAMTKAMAPQPKSGEVQSRLFLDLNSAYCLNPHEQNSCIFLPPRWLQDANSPALSGKVGVKRAASVGGQQFAKVDHLKCQLIWPIDHLLSCLSLQVAKTGVWSFNLWSRKNYYLG